MKFLAHSVFTYRFRVQFRVHLRVHQ